MEEDVENLREGGERMMCVKRTPISRALGLSGSPPEMRTGAAYIITAALTAHNKVPTT